MLGAHDDVASFPESHIFIRGRRRAARFAPGLVARKNLQNFTRSLGLDGRYGGLRLSLRPQRHQRELIAILDELASEQEKKVWIEKTPNHVLSVPEIRRLVPSSRFIHLVRDGRAVVASLYEVTRRHPDIWGGSMTIEQCVEEWNRAILASSAAMETGSDGIAVAYESLASNPADEMQRLCQFVGLRYRQEMVTAYAGVATVIVNSNEAWKGGVSSVIRDNGLRKYLDLFSPEQRIAIESSLVPLPPALGLAISG